MCEGISCNGTTGGISRGLQVFLPLSPKVLVMLYDGIIYKVGDKKSRITRLVPDGDIKSLNFLQVVGAEDNLYFADWNKKEEIEKLVKESNRFRDFERTKVAKYVEVGSEEGGRIIQMYDQMPDRRLNLSFVRITRKARRIPSISRLMKFRKKMPDRYDRSQIHETEFKNKLFRRKE